MNFQSARDAPFAVQNREKEGTNSMLSITSQSTNSTGRQPKENIDMKVENEGRSQRSLVHITVNNHFRLERAG